MSERKDNIYIYIWEELNTIYIGRTIDPKRRHRQHRSRERERTYQFSSKYGVKHPSMIILETNLSIDNGIERERYWIDYYRKNTQYNVLNKSYGGELGSLGESNDEKRKQYLKEYYQKNKEKYRESERKYRQKHLEKVREKDRIRYYKNKTPRRLLTEEEKKIKSKEYKKKYRETHKDKIRTYNKLYRENHKKT